MKNWKESYKAKICTPDEAIQKIKDAKRISFGHICSESTVLTEALLRNKKLFKKLLAQRAFRVIHCAPCPSSTYMH